MGRPPVSIKRSHRERVLGVAHAHKGASAVSHRREVLVRMPIVSVPDKAVLGNNDCSAVSKIVMRRDEGPVSKSDPGSRSQVGPAENAPAIGPGNAVGRPPDASVLGHGYE